MNTPPTNSPRRRSPTSRTASPRFTKPLSEKSSPKSTAPSTPRQHTRDSSYHSSFLVGRKRASPTPSDIADSERSPSSVMLMSPSEVSEQQGSIEQVIKSIEKRLKEEQNKLAKIILEKQQKPIRYKLENHMDAHLTPFVMIKKVGKSSNEEGVKKDPVVKSKTQSSAIKPSTQKRSQTLPSNLKKSSSISSKSPSAGTAPPPTLQGPTKRICTCGDPNSIWCFVCESRRFKNDFPKWTSGNKMIDNFIKEIQLFAESEVNYLEWISYDRLREVKYICDGTYASLSLATWLDGPRNIVDKQSKKLKRDVRKKVVLRQLHDSENISEVYLGELNRYYKKISWNNSIMPVYGISKDPKTKNFIIVYEHAEHGDLNNYLQENSANMSWQLKLALACDISKSLKTLHSCNLIHRDIHSGNILILKNGSTALADFGICKHVNSEKGKLNIGQVEGVLPFIAPEVIKTQKYSKQSDIYSFSMVMWEISSGGKRPFSDQSHDAKLALGILEGKRPSPVPGTPPCWMELIEQCWNENPDNRPDADFVHQKLCGWLKKLVETPKLPYDVNTEFTLAENWRVRGQYQSITPQHGAQVLAASSSSVEEDNTSQEESTTTTVVEPEGGIEVDASMVEEIESGLEVEEFQHPITCYTSQLFDFSELKFFSSTETSFIVDESSIDGESNTIDANKSDTTEVSANEEHSTIEASVSDTGESSTTINALASDTEEYSTINVSMSDIKKSKTVGVFDTNELGAPNTIPVIETKELGMVEAPVFNSEEPSVLDASAPTNEESSAVDVQVSDAEKIDTFDAIIVNDSVLENEKPSIFDTPISTVEKPEVVDATIPDSEESGTNDVIMPVDAEYNTLDATTSDNKGVGFVGARVLSSSNEEFNVPLWSTTIDVPVFVKPSSAVEKLMINTSVVNQVSDSVRSDSPDDETEADVKSDSPLHSEVSPPTSPSESEASNKNLSE
ncbi:2927_t:CDS:2 [Acaulospora morrowiae]|uniref:2927_t:CDS:1 n=1 Tax=Acaulospora morrowiae TaxID=94023 RepID=A0A9N9B3C5_9GLOM|nr:2927_t:CDS:2 [Acaulospora morrowiae]